LIGESLRYHGIALARLVQDARKPVAIEPLDGTSRCAYLVNGETAIYVKYATSRLSPWRFAFSVDQRRHLDVLADRNLWLILVCGNEGVLTVLWSQVEAGLDANRNAQSFSLQASRRRGEKFRLSGASDKPLLISENDFPSKVLA
jgi:hypothetical protein